MKSPKKFKLKKNLGWNCQIVDENRSMDMWYEWANCDIFYPIHGWMLKFGVPL